MPKGIQALGSMFRHSTRTYLVVQVSTQNYLGRVPGKPSSASTGYLLYSKYRYLLCTEYPVLSILSLDKVLGQSLPILSDTLLHRHLPVLPGSTLYLHKASTWEYLKVTERFSPR